MKVIILESPYSGNIPLHVAYTQRAMAHARSNKEIVIIPHLMWTQHHLSRDHYVSDYNEKYDIPNGGRDISLEQIKELRRRADLVVFYVDYGYSSGMKHGLEHCKSENIPYEERILGNTEEDKNNIINRKIQ